MNPAFRWLPVGRCHKNPSGGIGMWYRKQRFWLDSVSQPCASRKMPLDMAETHAAKQQLFHPEEVPPKYSRKMTSPSLQL